MLKRLVQDVDVERLGWDDLSVVQIIGQAPRALRVPVAIPRPLASVSSYSASGSESATIPPPT